MKTERIRLDCIDTFRGIAIVMMMVFHLCYDLNYFGWTQFPMTNSLGWILWRILIVSIFLSLVGISSVLRDTFKPSWQDFWQRWRQIAGAAIVVSTGSYLMFPDSYIYFGILHLITLSLIFARLLLKLGVFNLILGGLVIVMSNTVSNPIFNSRWLNWTGLATQSIPSEDFVPVVPWFGTVLIGCALGTMWRQHKFQTPQFIFYLSQNNLYWFTWMGRHSLILYLLHQPVMIATIIVIKSFK